MSDLLDRIGDISKDYPLNLREKGDRTNTNRVGVKEALADFLCVEKAAKGGDVHIASSNLIEHIVNNFEEFLSVTARLEIDSKDLLEEIYRNYEEMIKISQEKEERLEKEYTEQCTKYKRVKKHLNWEKAQRNPRKERIDRLLALKKRVGKRQNKAKLKHQKQKVYHLFLKSHKEVIKSRLTYLFQASSRLTGRNNKFNRKPERKNTHHKDSEVESQGTNQIASIIEKTDGKLPENSLFLIMFLIGTAILILYGYFSSTDTHPPTNTAEYTT